MEKILLSKGYDLMFIALECSKLVVPCAIRQSPWGQRVSLVTLPFANIRSFSSIFILQSNL